MVNILVSLVGQWYGRLALGVTPLTNHIQLDLANGRPCPSIVDATNIIAIIVRPQWTNGQQGRPRGQTQLEASSAHVGVRNEVSALADVPLARVHTVDGRAEDGVLVPQNQLDGAFLLG